MVSGLVFLVLKVQPLIDHARVQTSTERIRFVVLSGVNDFRKKHGRLPGDLNKDGIIGRRDFGETLLPLPSETEEDEARLFWKELALEPQVEGDNLYPLNLLDTYLIAGYLDGKPLSLGGATIQGNVLVWTGKLYPAGSSLGKRRYPLRPEDAAYAERKMEVKEVGPKAGSVQAYGSADCFTADGGYNLDNTGKSCGLIIRIFDK